MLKVCIVQLIDNGAYGHEWWRKKTEMLSLSLSLFHAHQGGFSCVNYRFVNALHAGKFFALDDANSLLVSFSHLQFILKQLQNEKRTFSFCPRADRGPNG